MQELALQMLLTFEVEQLVTELGGPPQLASLVCTVCDIFLCDEESSVVEVVQLEGAANKANKQAKTLSTLAELFCKPS